MILLQLLLVGRKIVQIRQTEPVGVCPEAVHRYSEWFSLSKTQGNKKEEIRIVRISSLCFAQPAIWLIQRLGYSSSGIL